MGGEGGGRDDDETRISLKGNRYRWENVSKEGPRHREKANLMANKELCMPEGKKAPVRGKKKSKRPLLKIIER